VDALEAATRWGQTWERGWTQRETAAIAALYAPDAIYRSHPHRGPEPGGAAAYVSRVFAEESAVECWFGEPIAAGPRAAVEWWASFVEAQRDVTLSGTTILTFDSDGLVVDHVDYWVQSDGRLSPFTGWAGRS
jgi:SnoaL-like protein